MRLRALLAGVVALAGALLAAAVGLASARVHGAPELSVVPPFRAAPLLVSGTDAYRNGEYLYQDYLLDDRGADTVPGAGSSAQWASQPLFSPTAGDVLYPSDPRFRGEAADLVELRLKLTPAALVYRVTFAVPSAAGTAAVGIGVSTHPPGQSPARQVAWPFGAGVSSPNLDWFITAWGTGGAVSNLATGSSTPLTGEEVRWDRTRAQMTISVPRSIMEPRGTWRYVAGTGLWGGHGWLQALPGAQPDAELPVSGNPLIGAPAILNLAFRFHEPVFSSQASVGSPYTTAPGVGDWFEDDQARNLAQGTSGDDFADVDFDALAQRADRFIHAPGAVQARIYGSRFAFTGGVDHSSFPEFDGPLQPYLLRIPPGYRPGHATPLLFSLHPSNSGYTVFNVSMPNWGAELGDTRGSLVVTPLSRGLDGPDPNSGAFTGAAELDFFEVWRDVERHFDIDPARVSLSGYSLGAYDDYALAQVWPGLFANVFSVVGAPPSNGMNTELLGNLRWEPVLAWNQLDDSEVPYTDASAASSGLTDLGLRHEQWTFSAGSHLGPALRDDWTEAVSWLNATRVVSDPPRVTYGYYPALDSPRYGLVHDHAYWVTGIRLARGRARGDVSARSLAFGLGDPKPATYMGSATSGGSPAAVQGVRWGSVARLRRRNVLLLALSGVSRVRISGRGAHLKGRGLTVVVQTDVPTRVSITLAVCLGGRHLSSWVLQVPGGRHTFRTASCSRRRRR